MLNVLMEKYQHLDHHQEHAFVSVDDHIANLISKLEKREDKSEGRITDLEQSIKKKVTGEMDSRVSRVEWQLTGKMHNNMKDMVGELGKQIGERVEASVPAVPAWRGPFLFLIVLMLLAAAGVAVFYRQLMKHHIL
jgi:hypothetical protein